VLSLIARSGGKPWFPSSHAAATGADRDALDEPLTQLRLAGLIRIAEWERGLGQGYVLTPDGEVALAGGGMIPARSHEPSAPPTDTPPPVARPPRSARWVPDTRPLVVVPILLAVNLLWFFVGLVLVMRMGQPVWTYLTEGNLDVLHRLGAVNGLDLLRGEWWRLATSCFVHIGGAHLLLNLFALIIVGPLAEIEWGRYRLIIIYLISGLAGSSLGMALKPDSLLAGASGAIWGLLMSLVAWLMLYRHTLPPDFAAESMRRLIVVIVLNAMFSLMPGISWQAHLGGGLAGFLTAGLLDKLHSSRGARRVMAFALLLALAAGCIGGLAAAMTWGKQWAGYREAVADDERRIAARTAAERFDRDVRPLLDRLKPTMMATPQRGVQFELLPTELTAMNQLIRPGERRNATRVAEARAKLSELQGIADAAVTQLQDPPVGVESLDRYRARARDFAEARGRSFALLLAMLDSPAIPDETAWSSWIESCRTADALWLELAKH